MKRVALVLTTWALMACGAQAVVENFTAAEGYTDGAPLDTHPNWVAQTQWTNRNSVGTDGAAETTNGNSIRGNYQGFTSANKVGDSVQMDVLFNLIGDLTTNRVDQAWKEQIFTVDLTENLTAAAPAINIGVGLYMNRLTDELQLRIGSQTTIIGNASNYNGHVWALTAKFTKTNATTYVVTASLDSQDDAAGPTAATNSVSVNAGLAEASAVHGYMKALNTSAESYGGVQVDRFEISDPTDPKLTQQGDGFSFGSLYHETGTDQTVLQVTYENAGIATPLTIDGVSVTDSAGGVYTLVSAPPNGTVVAVGETFDVEVAAMGGGGWQTYNGELTIDVSHGGDPVNNQDRVDSLHAVVSTAGDRYLVLDNWTLDNDLAGWGGNAAPTDGLISPNGARVRGIGDNRSNLAEAFTNNLEQAFKVEGAADFGVSLAFAIPDFQAFTTFAPTASFYDRSFTLAIMATGTDLPGTGSFTDAHGSNTIINLCYFPGGAGASTTPGFYLFDGTTFQLVPELGTLMASTDLNDDGTPPGTLNVYRLNIEGRNFGTASASYSISISGANTTNISGTANNLTYYRGADLKSEVARAVVLTTGDPTGSATNPSGAYQPSFWVDDLGVFLTATLPAAFFAHEVAAGAPKVVPGGSKPAFTVISEGSGAMLTISSIMFGHPDLSLASPALPVSIPSGSSMPFAVKASASATPGILSDTVTLVTDDALSATQTVDVALNVFASSSVPLVDFDDGVANGMHEASIRNGGFEEGVAGQSLDDTPAWSTKHPDGTSTEQLTFATDPATDSLHGRTGSWRNPGALFIPVHDLSPEDWTFEEGDYFTVEFKWKASDGFNVGSHTFNTVMMARYADGRLITPVPDRPIQDERTTTQTAAYNTVSFATDPVPADSIWLGLGFRFMLEVGDATPDAFAYIDDVTLIGHFAAGAATPSEITYFEAGAAGAGTVRFTDNGASAFVIDLADDPAGLDTPTSIPVDLGSADTNSVPGEIEVDFTDPAPGDQRTLRIRSN